MASARSLQTFNRGKQLNCSLLSDSTCRAVNLSKATKVPVVDQYAVQKLSQHENKQKSKPKTTKQKQAKTHNHNKNQTKTTERSGIATSNGNYMHDDILCVILRMAQKKKQNRTNTKHTNGPCWWVRESSI